MVGFVYKWRNIINGKWYIGSHKGTSDDGYRHSSKPLLAAEKKYGIESFEREILFEGDYINDNIKKVEAEYLKTYNAAHNRMSYNQTNITGSNHLSKDVCEKISQTLKGNIPWNKGITGHQQHSIETRMKISKKLAGVPKPPRTREHSKNISKAKAGKKLGPQTEIRRKNISKALTGKKQNQIICPHCNRKGGNAMYRWHFDNCKELI